MADNTRQSAVLTDDERRREILEAALHSFLQFGYSKTSMDDVAKRAGLSRPLIYLKFKNKEDLFFGVFNHLLEGRFEEAEAVLKQSLSKREKLLRVCESLLLGPWDKVVGHPMTGEFYNLCDQILPGVTERYQRQYLKYAQNILGDKDAAEVFFMAIEGLHVDLPSTKILRKRVLLLVDRFVQ